jgi:archaellum biogenesis protein FlaJ (TadC family)
MTAFIYDHEALLLWLTITSVIGLVASLVVIPWILIQIPSDYFSHKKRQTHPWHNDLPILSLVFLLMKNILGVIFIISGIIMLFIPGQGIITIIIGVILADFPYKYRIEQWIISHPAILRYINELRAQAKQSPIEV